MTNNLFFELGFEELPVNSLKALDENVMTGLKSLFSKYGFNETVFNIYVTPRRLALFTEDFPASTEMKEEELKGPPAKNIFENGVLTKSGEGFLKSKQIKVEEINVKGDFVYFKKKSGGESMLEIFSREIWNIINSTQFEKRMKWDNSKIEFPRPIRWICAFYNNSLIEIKIGDVSSAAYSFGNRSLGNQRIPVFNGYDYFEKMNENYVEPDFEKRKEMILSEIAKTAIKDVITSVIDGKEIKSSLNLVEDEELLDEVANLVEYPVVFTGKFDERFLVLPKEIIIAALKQHQRYFTMTFENGDMAPYFVFVANAPYSDRDEIVSNNQRIISSRLEDAEFYFKNDTAKSLSDYEESLKRTVFQEQLGTFYDKTERNRILAEKLSEKTEFKFSDGKILSVLCKFDIASEMIKDGKEFTKLQGAIGYYYAKMMGFDESKSVVSKEHYMPLTINSELPKTSAGIVFSIADKIDNIAGAFVSGNKPTGSKDIMSVRRDSLALIYLILEKNIDIDLKEWFDASLTLFKRVDMHDEIMDYLKKRIEVMFSNINIPYDITRCVMSEEKLNLIDIKKKAESVIARKGRDEFLKMVTGQKRIVNILKNAQKTDIKFDSFENIYESSLFEKGSDVKMRNVKLLEERKYDKVLDNLLSLREPIDALFDNVMVMDNDESVRMKRLALLVFIENVFLCFGDFSKIVFENSSQDNPESKTNRETA